VRPLDGGAWVVGLACKDTVYTQRDTEEEESEGVREGCEVGFRPNPVILWDRGERALEEL